MANLKELIRDYLDGWTECEYCNDMVKIEFITNDNEDNAICKECNTDRYGEA